MNNILEFVSENAVAIVTAICLTAIEITIALKGKTKDAKKIREKNQKILKRILSKHEKTEQAYIEEERNIKELKEVIENGKEN